MKFNNKASLVFFLGLVGMLTIAILSYLRSTIIIWSYLGLLFPLLGVLYFLVFEGSCNTAFSVSVVIILTSVLIFSMLILCK